MFWHIKIYWYEFKEKVGFEFKEKIGFALAFKLPKFLVYYCAIRVIANASSGKYSLQDLPKLKAMDALKRWKDD